MSNEIIVSVICPSYNHEAFIGKCIEGFVMQQTNFSFEVLINDDASTDKTADIVREYAEKYPDIIYAIYQTENQYSKSISPFSKILLPHARGKYIALCEGDDYWTDPYKLQKQVDFLEANPDYSLCFHDAIVLWDDKRLPPKYFCDKNQKETSTIEDVIKGWFIPSASMVFRKEAIIPLPEWFSSIYNGDWGLQMIVASKGNIGYINKPMSVYRKSSTALSGTVGKRVEFINEKRIVLLRLINKITNGKYEKTINDSILKLNYEIRLSFLRKKNYPLFILRKAADRMLIELSKLFSKYT